VGSRKSSDVLRRGKEEADGKIGAKPLVESTVPSRLPVPRAFPTLFSLTMPPWS
jgi:hypothetical protein